ncbi:DUF2935 domain-containing protein [Paenibacillus sp. LMG 31461]|uniref:DUF2935 domain-containing protein n=1 Tax=Paenibacillus plantarum TaxID=2654975 RepID=A0ABX1X877_9BACL|nr:DUF2935 domain-containing protein [Paenibacillus plantarum]NOU64190.1 DUF2935 domain-containing protein [Paenibacillus plantarum]
MPPGFPAEAQFAKGVLGTVKAFYDFVQRIIVQYRDDQLLSKATLRFLEHHFPESCYFMRKLTVCIPDASPLGSCPLTRPC